MGDPLDDFFGGSPEEQAPETIPSYEGTKTKRGIGPRGRVVYTADESLEEMFSNEAAFQANKAVASDDLVYGLGKSLGFGHEGKPTFDQVVEIAQKRGIWSVGTSDSPFAGSDTFGAREEAILDLLESKTGTRYNSLATFAQMHANAPVEGLTDEERGHFVLAHLLKSVGKRNNRGEIEGTRDFPGGDLARRFASDPQRRAGVGDESENVPGSAWQEARHNLLDTLINSDAITHTGITVPELRSAFGLIDERTQAFNAARLFVGENASINKVQAYEAFAGIDRFTNPEKGLRSIPGLTMKDYFQMVRLFATKERNEEAIPFSEESLERMGPENATYFREIRELASKPMSEDDERDAMRAVRAINAYRQRAENNALAKSQQKIAGTDFVLNAGYKILTAGLGPGEIDVLDKDTDAHFSVALQHTVGSLSMGLGTPEFLEYMGADLDASSEDWQRVYDRMPQGWKTTAAFGEIGGMLMPVTRVGNMLTAISVKTMTKRFAASEAGRLLMREQGEAVFKAVLKEKQKAWAAKARHATLGMAMGIVSATNTGARTQDFDEAAKAFGSSAAIGWMSGAASSKLLQVLTSRGVSPMTKSFMAEFAVEFGVNAGMGLANGREGLTWEEIVAGAAWASIFAFREGASFRAAERMEGLLDGTIKPTKREQKILAEAEAVDRTMKAAGVDTGDQGLRLDSFSIEGDQKAASASRGETPIERAGDVDSDAARASDEAAGKFASDFDTTTAPDDIFDEFLGTRVGTEDATGNRSQENLTATEVEVTGGGKYPREKLAGEKVESNGVDFRPVQRAAGETVVTLSPRQIKDAINRNGGLEEAKYDRFLEFVEDNPDATIGMPEMGLNDKGELVFTNGRHRSAALVDFFDINIPVTMSAADAVKIGKDPASTKPKDTAPHRTSTSGVEIGGTVKNRSLEDGNAAPLIRNDGTVRHESTLHRQPIDKAVGGKRTPVEIDGRKVDARYAVVEMDAVTASHDPHRGFDAEPDYPADLQPRDYKGNRGAQDRVRENARADRYDPTQTINTAGGAQVGPTTISPDGIAINGNGRHMTERLLPADAEARRMERLREEAQAVGIDPARLDEFERPKLVRIVDIDPRSPEAQRFAESGNESVAARQSPIRTGAGVAKSIPDEKLPKIGSADDTDGAAFGQYIRTSAEGKQFVDALYDALPATDRDVYFHQDSRNPNAAGMDLIRDVLLTKSFSVEAVENMTASQRRKLAPNVAQIAALRADPQTREFTDALDRALETQRRMNKEGYRNLDEAREQGRMFDQDSPYDMDASSESILRFLDSGASSAEVRDRLVTLARRTSGQENTLSFLEPESPADLVIDVFGPVGNGYTNGVGGDGDVRGQVFGMPGAGDAPRMPRERLPSEVSQAPAPEAGTLAQIAAHGIEGRIEPPDVETSMDGATAPRAGAERDAVGQHTVINAATAAVNADNPDVVTRLGRTASPTAFSPRNAAQYDMQTHVIRLGQAGNYSDAIHEAGHAVEQTFFNESGITDGTNPNMADIIDELDGLGQRLYPDGEPARPSGSARGWVSEGFAELMYLHHTRPDELKLIAPKAQAELIRWIGAKKERARAWNQVARLVKTYNTQNPMLRLMGNIEFGRQDEGKRWRAAFMRMLPWSPSARIKWIDGLDPLNTISRIATERLGGLEAKDNPWIIGQVLRKSHTSVAAKMIRDGIYSPDGHAIYDKGLSEAFEIAGRNNTEAFLTYLIALRGKERINHARANGKDMSTDKLQKEHVSMTEAEADSIIDFVHANPEMGDRFQRGSTIVHNFFDGLLQYMEDWGALTPEMRAKVVAGSKHYVPMERVLDDIDIEGALAQIQTAKASGGIGRFIGSSKRFRDPASGMIEKTVSMVQAAHKQAVINATIRLAERVPGLGRFIEEVPVEQMHMGTKVIEDFKGQLRKQGLDLNKIQNRADQMHQEINNLSDAELIERAQQARAKDRASGYRAGRRFNDPTFPRRGAAARQRRTDLEGVAREAVNDGMHLEMGTGLDRLNGRNEIVNYIMAVEGMPVGSIDEMQVEWFAPRQDPNGTDPIVPFVDADGNRRWFRMNEEMYGVFGNLEDRDVRQWGIVGKVLHYGFVAPARFFRASTTSLNPGFALFTNPTRDFLTFHIQNETGNPVASNTAYIKHLASAIGHDSFGDIVGMKPNEVMEFFERWGGPMSARGAEGGSIDFRSRARRHLTKGLDSGDAGSRIATSAIIGAEVGSFVGQPAVGAAVGAGISTVKQVIKHGRKIPEAATRVIEVAGQRIREIRNADNPIGEVVVQLLDMARGIGSKVGDIAGAQQERLGVAENAPRAAAMELALRDSGWRPGELITRNQMLEAMLRAKITTVDFSAAGEYAAVVNQMIPFFNVSIQGQRAMYRSMGKRPVATLLKGMMYATIPALFGYEQVHDQPFWQEMDPEERYRFMYFKAGDEVIRVPINPEVGTFFIAPMMMALDIAKHKEPEAFSGFMSHLVETMIPGVDGSLVQGMQDIRDRGSWKRAVLASTPNVVLPKAFIEMGVNMKSYTGRPVESRRLENLPWQERSTEYTSGTAIDIGETVHMSPVMIDHLMKSVGGPLVYDMAQWWNPSRAKELGDISEGMIKRRFFSRGGTTGTHSRSFDTMLNELERLETNAASQLRLEPDADKRRRLALNAAKEIILYQIVKSRHLPDHERRRVTTAIRERSRAAYNLAGRNATYDKQVKKQASNIRKKRKQELEAKRRGRSINSRLKLKED